MQIVVILLDGGIKIVVWCHLEAETTTDLFFIMTLLVNGKRLTGNVNRALTDKRWPATKWKCRHRVAESTSGLFLEWFNSLAVRDKQEKKSRI
jgi:hypothetical protein